MPTRDTHEIKSQTAIVVGEKQDQQVGHEALLEELKELRAEISRQARGLVVETLFEMRRQRDLTLRGLQGRATAPALEQEQTYHAPPELIMRTPGRELALLPPAPLNE